ncbi:MAG: glycosyltransferase family 39 protein [Elusimicrobiota bacterium]
MSERSSPRRWIVLAAALILLHAALGLWSITTHSATFDEPAHIASGRVFWERGQAVDTFHAPLPQLWAALPLLGLDLKVPYDTQEYRGRFMYAFGERLLYYSGNDADRLLRRARAMNLLLSLALAAVLWSWTRRRWGEAPAACALALYACSPSILAHATVAMTDMPAVFFMTLSILAFLSFLERPGRRPALAAAAAAAAALLCKFSALVLWPLFAAALVGEFLRDRRKGAETAACFARWACLPGLAAAVLYFVFYPPAAAGFIQRLTMVTGGEHPTFLLGRTSRTGWLAYYPVALLAKSTLVELAVLGAALWTLRRRAEAPPSVRVALLAAGLLLAVVAKSHIQVGARYILLIYPLLALAAAPLAARLIARTPRAMTILLAGGLLQAAAAFIAMPHFIAFFNQAAGGPANGYRILVDSNLDWGQELKALGAAHRRAGRPEVVLAYFGTASAEYHGVLAQQLKATAAIARRHRNSDRPRAEWLVVSATFLSGAYVGRETFAWLRGREPLMVLGHSLFVYDITRDGAAHRRLAELYAAEGDPALAARERIRAELIAAEEAKG